MSKILLLHGGAGKWRKDRLQKAYVVIKKLAEEGYQVLCEKGALDAVEYVIRGMEDSSFFNAGRGAALNLIGEIELDACIMVSDGRIGCVSGVKNVLHPITLARKIMEETDHIMLAGEGAELFAKMKELYVDFSELLTKRAREFWLRAVKNLLRKIEGEEPEDEDLQLILERYPKIVDFLKRNPTYLQQIRAKIECGDTVGAVAFDGKYLVAGTSTGGLPLKLPGRIGDTPIPGAGTYANEIAACSASGVGEDIIRVMLSINAVDYASMYSPEVALERIFTELSKRFLIRAGIIMVNNHGEWAIYHTTKYFLCAVADDSGIIVDYVWRKQ